MPSSKARYLSILATDLNATGQVPSSNVLLPDTGVSAGTYGSASLVPVLTIDTKGRVTTATTSNVAGVTSFGYNTGSGRLTINTADGASFIADVTLAPFSTTTLAEGTNQYFTTARARSSISASGSLSYNSSTGALTYTQDNTDTVSEGALNLYYTSTRSRGALSATTGSAAYNNTSGVITIPGTSSHITEGSNLFYTDTRARAAISGSTGVTYNSSTGAIAIGQAVGTTDNVTFNSVTVNGTLTSDDITSTNITASGDLTVSGNLTISGTTTTVNSTAVSVADINIELARNATTAAQANGAGITVTGPVTPATFTYTSSDDRWNLNKDLTVGQVYGNVTGAVTGNVTGAVTGNVTGAVTGNASTATTLQTTRSIATTGDATWTVNFDGSAAVSSALTLATVNANVGAFGSSTLVPVITVNAKGLVTAVSTASISGSISVTGGDLTLSGTTGTAITNATLATVNANVGTFTKLTVNAKGLVTAASAATTTDISEGTNLYYTDTRARASNSFVAGSGAYNSSTGVITIPTNNNQLTNGAGYITGYTEVDTLATVTGRGASTSTALTFSGGITSAGATLSGNLLFNNATSPNTNYIQFGDNTGWYLRIMTSVSGTPTQRFSFSDQGAFSAVGAITGSNLSGTNTGDNPGVTSVAGVTPIISSGGTTPSISHATSGVGAGTYNSVTVNTFGHVTAGSNIGYITGYTEVDTLATVTGRGATTSSTLTSTTTTPFALQGNSNTGTYTQTVIYANQNNTTANTANGIFIERGRITDSAAAEIRYLTIGARGGQIQWQVDGSGNTTQTGTIGASNFSGSHSGTSSGTNTGDNPGVTSVAGVTPIISSGGTTPSISHATSGVGAGTYNSVTVNTFGHVTAGSNIGYITGYTEVDTLATVTGRGDTTATLLKLTAATGGSTPTGTYALRVTGLSGYESLELGVQDNYQAVLRSYGNDIHYYAGHWRTTATASEDHSHYWYTAKNGNTNWNVYKMRLDHNGLLTASGGGAFNGITINQERTTNARIYSATTGAMGLLGVNSDGTFRFQIYGDGSAYGFLDSTWGNWDIQKTVNGNMLLRVSSTNYTVLHSGNVGSYAVTALSDTLATVTGRGATTSTALTLSGNVNMSGSGLFLNRNASATHGISWYSSGYTSWSTYMAAGGATSVGPTGNITAPSGTLVNSWALRNFVENPAGYGWTWESGAATGQPSVVAEIRSSDGAMRIAGAFTAVGTIGASNFSGSSSGTNTGDQTNISGTAGSETLATVTSRGNVTTGSIQLPPNNAYRFWANDDAYSIKMASASDFFYGPVTDYSIKITMGSGAGRGITFGQNGVAPVAAINTTSGNMQIAGTFAASNFSGSHSGTSSGTNTGDQTSVSGQAGYADYVAAQTNPVGNFNVGLTRPKGASYTTTASSVTGAIKIKMPAGVPLHGMWKMTVKIYEYGQRGNGYTIELGCHLYPSTAHNRYQWMITTDFGAVLPIRYGTDGTSGCIWIGENGTTWAYPQIHVTEFSNGFNNPGSVNWTTGTWAVTIGTIDNSVAVDGPYTTSLPVASAVTGGITTSNYNSYSPTLTGGGASGTWGISISGNAATATSAANATTAGGLAIHTGRNNEVNKIVRTDGNGYIQAGWINSDSGDSGFETRLTRITCSNDNYLRYLGLTDFKVSMGLSAKNNYSRRIDYTSDANYHVGSMGHSTAVGGANEAFHGGSGFFDIWGGSNMPGAFSHIHGINMVHYTTNSLGSTGGNAYGWQMANQYDSDAGPYFRRVAGGSFSSWRKMWHDGNDGSGSGLDADLLDGIDSAAFFQNNQDRTLSILRFTGVGGDSGVANQSYAIYQEGGSWTGPYPDLAIGYHTGIKIGANLGYNGTRIYNDANFATQIASFGDGDNNFRSYYNVIAYASDKRLKENVVNIDNALQKVMKLNGVTFDWKKEVTDLGFTPTAWHECGVLAQEVEAVLPEAVEIAPFDYDWKSEDGSHSKSGEKYLTVKYEKLVPLLIEAMKEQQSQIEAQQKQIDQLMNLVKEIIK